MYKGFPRI
ncbi:hypothetical protein VTH06DRAFT_2829 [Thermothelomyces fergusii]